MISPCSSTWGDWIEVGGGFGGVELMIENLIERRYLIYLKRRVAFNLLISFSLSHFSKHFLATLSIWIPIRGIICHSKRLKTYLKLVSKNDLHKFQIFQKCSQSFLNIQILPKIVLKLSMTVLIMKIYCKNWPKWAFFEKFNTVIIL